MAPAQKGSAVRVWMCRGRRPVSFVTISRNMKDPPSHLRGLICWLATAVRRGVGGAFTGYGRARHERARRPTPPFFIFTDCEIKTPSQVNGWLVGVASPFQAQSNCLYSSGWWAEPTRPHRPGSSSALPLILDHPPAHAPKSNGLHSSNSSSR